VPKSAYRPLRETERLLSFERTLPNPKSDGAENVHGSTKRHPPLVLAFLAGNAFVPAGKLRIFT
jgi:hypothetical protein